MRKRTEILKDGTRVDLLQLEVLLDMRDLMVKKGKAKKKERNNA